ncbi:3D (Asp-Asp-Asp) domain-containing protein/LysM repeat protein [Peribacillus deserti]|uniref:3D (Asp-Asp-Asp) domain-containing protein/LysM repeat protein n=1 Tax=Peribacillus deserti TaxID=673318 RepID=A0ABS2QMD9_9BACI|nr:3D domain-containing protein [Peribacillus deserti]MBM7693416.1 3D (Asp-Asp-Asp) domain-containing protein/LysM repeat protein [Peribacillus deserti]
MKKTLFSLVAAAALTGTMGVNAQADEMVVKKGDTLWRISQNHGVEVSDLKRWNNLKSDIIHPEQHIIVSPDKRHVVHQGETIWSIAKKYGVSEYNIKQWNNLSSDIIQPGQNLKVNSVSYSVPPQKTTAASKPAEAKPVAAQPAAARPTAAQPAAVKQEAAPAKVLTVNATAYTADCEGCSGITATGVNIKENPNAKVIAVDPSVIPLGSKVYVEGYGYATAEDTGGAIKGNRIDVFIPNEQNALNWGTKTVKVTVIK